MKKTDFTLLLIFLMSISIQFFASIDASAQCDRSRDSLILMEFYEATDGPNWSYTERIFFFDGRSVQIIPNAGRPWNPSYPIDKWHGVEVDQNGCVVTLALHQNNLTGSIPESLGSLSNLSVLFFQGNNLNGNIPSSFENLVNLKKIFFNNNDFSGCVPDLDFCNLSFSASTGDEGYNFTGNDLLPWHGAFENLCDIEQIGAPCDDRDSDTFDDVIQDDCSCKGRECRASDSLELVKLYFATGGPQWTYPSFTTDLSIFLNIPNARNPWRTNTPFSNWHGVQTDSHGCVQSLILLENNLDSILPQLNLPKLRTLYLNDNQLKGELPDFNHLKELRTLYLSNNSFEGEIPEFSLPKLYWFHLSNNHFEGPLPDFSLSSDLRYFDASHNNFEGSIPNLHGLSVFNVSNNQLTGSIPNLNNIANSSTVDFSNNKLTGSVPALEDNIKYFDCSNNQISGELPDFNSGAINYFDCSNNQISGPFPEMKRAPQLFEFYCQNNQISGEFPSLLSAQSLTHFNCSNNEIGGEFPKFSLIRRVKIFNCENNKIGGEFSPILGSLSLEELDCSNNLIGGELFDVKHTVITRIDCSYNQITGRIPIFETPNKLISVDCSFNKLEGGLRFLENIPTLREFRCRGNFLSQTIPPLEGLPSLIVFDCAENTLTGNIPNLKNTPNLREFYCEKNLFLNGEIPNFTFLSHLTYFNCSSNQLTGVLPLFSRNLKLKLLNFSNNQIIGSIPYTIGQLDSIKQFYGFSNQLDGCLPDDLENLCRIGKSDSPDSTGYNLTLNPSLPWQGDIEPFCFSEPQIGSPCDDLNPNTENDIIQADCLCAGSVPSSVSNVDEVDFQIYPNPTTGIINLPTIDFKNISLFNAAGQKIQVEISSTIDLNPFPAGIYYLKIQTNENIFLKKVVKK